MKTSERREELLNRLIQEPNSITGSKLAEIFDVSRQVIVQDIALLRAKGHKIVATSQGYVMSQTTNNMVQKTIACKHKEKEIRAELETIIKYGGRVKDVIVEHPIYGELKGLLMIQSKAELEEFLEKSRNESSKPLSFLTEGVHLHTIEALNQEVLDLIESKLQEKGFLLSEDE
ncbi:transcription repressor NadR [Natroniella sulfidigena]|uniref:transcription repressor NadR n=1 Tax=Natroniella sulfidigena TaxID=723921 RepID=UPI00200A44C4|nr:transcription repressor NadR [Natroniella sulfidigena]MCK8817316.1 transcription repressor NadR [Natroniella sulfidigena]